MAKTSTDTSLRIDQNTRNLLEVIAQREGIPIKSCVAKITEMIYKNQLSLSAGFVPVSKEIERVIKIIRAQEKDYFLPMLTGVNKIGLFQNQLISDAQNRIEREDLEKPAEEMTSFLTQAPIPDLAQEVNEKLQKINQTLVDKLRELTDDSRLTIKTGVGMRYYVIKLSEQELMDLKQTVQICITQ